ncbi:MAG: acyl-CoA dehydrogenase family protein [Polyangiaceae bacterium]|nr:acyl-CoA dehydrogenase family protein [Polyangiaceae bacterium]
MVNEEAIVRGVIQPQPLYEAKDIIDVLAIVGSDARPVEQAIDLALLHAPRVDRLGYAFAAGYVAATRTLSTRLELPLSHDSRVTLAATEEGGAHPRAIRTTLDGSRLRGSKRWATLAPLATHLLVIATEGDDGGRPKLRAVLVPTARPGIQISRMPETPFCPEIPHAQIDIDVEVGPGDVVDGDAFTSVLKPFRTIEDLCVQAAAIAWLGAMARRIGADRALSARAAALVLSVRGAFRLPFESKAAHITLGGLIDQTAGLVRDAEEAWPADREDRAWFVRDRPLLSIASRVREERLKKAWEAL